MDDSKLEMYTVILEDTNFGWHYFRCQAEDSNHAEEQATNAFPESKVLWINLGESIEMN